MTQNCGHKIKRKTSHRKAELDVAIGNLWQIICNIVDPAFLLPH